MIQKELNLYYLIVEVINLKRQDTINYFFQVNIFIENQ